MTGELRPICAAVVSGGRGDPGGSRRPPNVPEPPPRAVPFVTIARQAGVGAARIAGLLAERLTALDPGDRPWQAFDRELVERIAAEHRYPAHLVESLEETAASWLTTLIEGLSFHSRDPEEFALYRRVSQTVWALAASGRVVIVGRGGVFVTHGRPEGLHVMLVAPRDYRVRNLARRMGLREDAAGRRVDDIDANRSAFYRRHWPHHPLGPEAFAAVLNVAALGEQATVAALAELVMQRVRARA